MKGLDVYKYVKFIAVCILIISMPLMLFEYTTGYGVMLAFIGLAVLLINLAFKFIILEEF